ncbi:MAG: alanine racemase [Schumannella sp.]
MTGPTLILDLAGFRENVRTLAAMVAPARTMLAVKADAYGHGAAEFATAALEGGADSLAVLEVPAGILLREVGFTVPLFAWLHGRDTDFAAAITADIDLGVSSMVELERIAAAVRTAGSPASVHLKIDTGLHRNGASPEDWPALVSAARDAEREGLVRVVALWSHLADASPADDEAALAEFRAAVAVAAGLGVEPPLLHLAASSAGIREPEARLGLVRFGIAAYGISPFDDVDGRGLGLRPVMTFRAPVLALEDGVAVLAAGSGDGVAPVTAADGAAVLLEGVRRPVLGVDVDTMTVGVDATAGGRVTPGDVATVFGPGDDGEPTAEEWAAWAGTIGDEIVARASRRAARVIRR